MPRLRVVLILSGASSGPPPLLSLLVLPPSLKLCKDFLLPSLFCAFVLWFFPLVPSGKFPVPALVGRDGSCPTLTFFHSRQKGLRGPLWPQRGSATLFSAPSRKSSIFFPGLSFLYLESSLGLLLLLRLLLLLLGMLGLELLAASLASSSLGLTFFSCPLSFSSSSDCPSLSFLLSSGASTSSFFGVEGSLIPLGFSGAYFWA